MSKLWSGKKCVMGKNVARKGGRERESDVMCECERGKNMKST